MSFGREKRLWLAALALLAPFPLPFNQVLEWPYYFVYAVFVIHFLQRAERGVWITLSNLKLNLLGLVSIPLIAFDLRAAFFRNSVVTALAHLLMFLLVVKLYSIRREKDKWHIMVAIFFLFIGSMATSSHVTIAPYLLAFMVLSLLVLGRFAHLHMMVPLGQKESRATAPPPYRAPLMLGTLLVVLVAVPLFATMPRIREPFILGRGAGSAGMARTTGFSDSVDLSLTTSIRGNRNVAMRVQYEDDAQLGDAASLRFKGAAYDRYENRNWFRDLRQAEVLIPKATESLGRLFDLKPGAGLKPSERLPEGPGSGGSRINKAEVFLEAIGSTSLLLPIEALSLELDLQTTVGRDPGGAVLLPVQPRQPIRYQVDLAREPIIAARLSSDPENLLSALDLSGLTPRMTELAQQVMGVRDGEEPAGDEAAEDPSVPGERSSEWTVSDRTDDERIDLLERHLLTQYSYTLDYLGRTGESPLEDFLFVYRSGHCELFASAMVLMLRSQGIPARLVTGFLGAELNPLEGYYVVRQQNAHAWVEAYTPNRGWRIYDPTPPDGRPTVAEQNLALLISQIYDYITFRWDRYVLTYGADDQDSFLRKMRERMRRFWGNLKDLVEKEPVEPPTPFAEDTAIDEEPYSPWIWQPQTSTLIVLLAIFVGTVAALVIWNRRRPLSGQAAYLRLRRRLEGSGLEITEAQAPLDLLERAVERFPSAAGPLRHVVGHYVRESFAGRELAEGERRGLRDALQAVEEELAEDRKRQRRERRGRRLVAAA